MYGSPYSPYCGNGYGQSIGTTADFIPSNSLVMGNQCAYPGSAQIISAGVQSFPPIVSTGCAGAPYSSRALIPPTLRPTTPVYGVTPGLVGSGVYGNQGCLGCQGCCGPTCGPACCAPGIGGGCNNSCFGCLGCFGCDMCCCLGNGVGTIGGIGAGCCGAGCGGCPGCFGCGCGPTAFGGQVGYGLGCCPGCGC